MLATLRSPKVHAHTMTESALQHSAYQHHPASTASSMPVRRVRTGKKASGWMVTLRLGRWLQLTPDHISYLTIKLSH